MELIKKARQDKGWTMRELANRVNVSPSTISNIENGKHEPSHDLMELLSRELAVPLNDLVKSTKGLEREESSPDDAVKQFIEESTTAIKGIKNSNRKLRLLIEFTPGEKLVSIEDPLERNYRTAFEKLVATKAFKEFIDDHKEELLDYFKQIRNKEIEKMNAKQIESDEREDEDSDE